MHNSQRATKVRYLVVPLDVHGAANTAGEASAAIPAGEARDAYINAHLGRLKKKRDFVVFILAKSSGESDEQQNNNNNNNEPG